MVRHQGALHAKLPEPVFRFAIKFACITALALLSSGAVLAENKSVWVERPVFAVTPALRPTLATSPFAQQQPAAAPTQPAAAAQAEPQATNATAAAAASPASQIARLHVYRPSQFVGGALFPSIYVDGTQVARVGNGRRVTIKLSPGSHYIKSDDKGSAITLDVKAGQDYFVRLDEVQGLMKGKGKVTLMPTEQGAYEYNLQRPIEENRVTAPEMVEAGQLVLVPSGQLEADITRMIRTLEGADHPGCELQVVKQVHSSDRIPIRERWDVKSCDATSSYDVEIVPSPKGGSDFRVVKSAPEIKAFKKVMSDQQPPPFEWKENEGSPGVTLTATERKRISGREGPVVIFDLNATGFGAEEDLTFWTKYLGGNKYMRMSDVSLDEKGAIQGKLAGKPVPIDVAVGKMAAGEPISWVLASATTGKRAYARAVIVPIEAHSAEGCSASAELGAATGLEFHVTFRGFAPGEEVEISSEFKKDNKSSEGHADDKGALDFPVLFGEGDHGKARATAVGKACKVLLEYQVGPDALVKRSAWPEIQAPTGSSSSPAAQPPVGSPAATADTSPEQWVPYEGQKSQFTIALPKGWVAYDQSLLPMGKGNSRFNLIVFYLSSNPGAQDSTTVRFEMMPVELMTKIDSGEIPSFFFQKLPAKKAMSCAGFSESAEKDVLKVITSDPVFGKGAAILEAPRSEPISVAGCKGIRVRGSGQPARENTPQKLDAYAVSDGKALYLFTLRNQADYYKKNVEVFQKSMATAKLSAATP